MLTLDKIYHAAFVLKDVARKTDLIEAPKLSKDCQLYLKTENLQATGSFKVRGAYYKISQLSEEESAKGVIACSAGNHAQGVALAATRRGIRSIVCMPDGAPLMKVENTKNLGAEVCLVPGTYDEAHDKAVQLQKEYDMTFIHPYDDEQVIAGQGTIGLEILDQLPDVDAVVVPVGGGGLISGIAFAIKTLRPEVKVYGVQAADDDGSRHHHRKDAQTAAKPPHPAVQPVPAGGRTQAVAPAFFVTERFLHWFSPAGRALHSARPALLFVQTAVSINRKKRALPHAFSVYLTVPRMFTAPVYKKSVHCRTVDSRRTSAPLSPRRM